MNKLRWLEQIALLHPEDAEAHYWLAKELEQESQWLEALQAYSAGLGVCNEEQVRTALIQGITEAGARLQGKPLTAVDVIPEADTSEGAVDETGNAEENMSLPSATPDQETGELADDRLPAGPHPSGLLQAQAGLKVIPGGKAPEVPVKSGPAEVTFSDVAGLQQLKKTIQLRIISPFQNQTLFSKFRKKIGGGVLLYGPPGCGKTFITKATAGECKATFIPVSITDVLDPYIGVSEQNLKSLFDKARSQKPSIMFFDEIDTVGYSRSKSTSHMRGLIDTFLTEMEGIDTNTDQILIIGATNMPWDVDSALKRPGRFDRMIFVAPPDEEAREQMFHLKLAGRYAEGMDMALLARRTEFFSGADIENVCERAAERVLEEILDTGRERPIRMQDLEAVLQEVLPSTMEWLRTVKNYVKYANQSGAYNDVEAYLKKHGRLI